MPGSRFDVTGLKFTAGLLLVLSVVFAGFHFGALDMGKRLYIAATSTSSDLVESETKAGSSSPATAIVEAEAGPLLRPAIALTDSVPLSRVDAEIPEEGKFIAADLETMKLFMYEDGSLVATYTIVSKGRPGSHWETPTGSYEINTKAVDHFSSIGKVHMPYSMQFYGNFFIHGWPYYPDGTPVGEGYSGGCIRLATEDASEVFDFAEYGTPLYVHEGGKRLAKERLQRLAVDTARTPTTLAKSYFVADIETGDILLSKNPRKRYPIASITKLMTAIVANETIAYSREIATGGDRYELGDLYYPLFMRSSNVVAEEMANTLGRKRFMNEMNTKAKALGMYATYFDDASGLSEKNASTAWDLYYLARYLHEKKAFLLTISQIQEKTITGANGRKWPLTNQNKFADDPMFVGGKLGYTEAALQTSLGIFSVTLEGGEQRTIAIIILGSSDWKSDTRNILEWLPGHVYPAESYATSMPAAVEL
jgi:hypothetical protein